MSKDKNFALNKSGPKFDALRKQLRPFLKDILKAKIAQELKEGAALQEPKVEEKVTPPPPPTPEVKLKAKPPAVPEVKAEDNKPEVKAAKKKSSAKVETKHKEEGGGVFKSASNTDASSTKHYEHSKVVSQMVLDLRMKDYPIVQSATILDGDLDHFMVTTVDNLKYICEFSTDDQLNKLRGFPEALLGSCKAIPDL